MKKMAKYIKPIVKTGTTKPIIVPRKSAACSGGSSHTAAMM